jgi:two-component system sensor histidine kinase ChvG
VLYIDPFREGLMRQRGQDMMNKAALVSGFFGAAMPRRANSLYPAPGFDPQQLLLQLPREPGVSLYLFSPTGEMIASVEGAADAPDPAVTDGNVITGALDRLWNGLRRISGSPAEVGHDRAALRQTIAMIPAAVAGETRVETGLDQAGNTVFVAVAPVVRGDETLGVVGVTSGTGELRALVQTQREQVLQMFVMAVLVSIGLSLVLASTIANPLADLATAAELGRDRHARKMSPNRVRIPDLTARPDEIGRLSGALRGMVAALYDRIEANEQFAADVAHELKNPLASLRSAVGTLRVTKRDDHREKLLDVIEHDVRRLDRLISDISNASRLDSELVREAEAPFDLLKMLMNISHHFAQDAQSRGVEFITDLPAKPIIVHGLEARLAQVFVNLISNAVSFCEAGDAVRVWARRRENRVLVVVEDTGLGIPEQAIQKIFNRFYSERPPGQFGNHSGLGLAISKQIVEAHGGVIWAENIRPTNADLMSEPLGARFVVGLPI